MEENKNVNTADRARYEIEYACLAFAFSIGLALVISVFETDPRYQEAQRSIELHRIIVRDLNVVLKNNLTELERTENALKATTGIVGTQ